MTRSVSHKPELFFAFPDGALDYVCAECTALCCKGFGFGGSLKREMGSLFARYPQLQIVAISREGDQVTFATTGCGCVMLDTDNLCRIEKELGKDHKPNICNLFPFNAFARIGRTVAVMPHFLCPLRAVVPARPGTVRGTHALIEDQIRKSQMLDRDYMKSMVPKARLHSSVTEATAIEREKTFRERCSQALGENRFVEILLSASSDPPALADFTHRAARVLGYESSPRADECDLIDAYFLAFASAYRIGLLYLTEEQILRALVVAEMLARQAWSGATQTPTLQGIVNTVSTLRPVQVLLAKENEPFDFGKLRKKTLSFRDPELTFAAFITAQKAGSDGVLKALEQAIALEMSIADRSVLLMRLGEIVHTARMKPQRKQRASIDSGLSLPERPGSSTLS